jgi:dienelactone hydrolase
VRRRQLVSAVLAAGLACAVPLATPSGAGTRTEPAPGSPAYVQRDLANIAAAYGRQTAADGQRSPTYARAVVGQQGAQWAEQFFGMSAAPTRPPLDPGQLVPGWNSGSPYRATWAGHRGVMAEVRFTNRYGALLTGDVFAPLPGARDPYTGRRLRAPYPGVVLTTGSVQGSERMYWWAAQDLAERGYVVLTYDVQGQGRSETLPHGGPVTDLPYCALTDPSQPGEMSPCPGVPFQQTANFVYGTEDAIDFFVSTPRHPAPNREAGSADVTPYNPFWKLFDRSPDRDSATPGRHTRLALVGHSLGATAVSYVQAVDKRVAAVVALDKLSADPGFTALGKMRPVVPSLGVQSEYGFNVYPYVFSHGSSIAPQPGPPDQGPDPRREERTGYSGWAKAGVDTMVVVPRASTHLEYTDIPWVLPASRYGQDLTSVYMQAWLDKYLKHDRSADRRLLGRSWRYLEPVDVGVWRAVTLRRDPLLSFYYCSGFAFRSATTGRLLRNDDIARVGCH